MSSEKGKAINWNEVIGEEALGESGLDLWYDQRSN